MKKVICMLTALVFLLCGCSSENPATPNAVFTQNERGNLVSSSGTEYVQLANEGGLYYFGELEFVGSVQGEEAHSQHLGLTYRTGMFAIKNDGNRRVMIRYAPDNEWYSIYRKISLPAMDFSLENCIRLEFIAGTDIADEVHTTCGDGITDLSEIAAFQAEVRAQKSPDEAGVYDLVRETYGALERCYEYGAIYGFFPDEPNLAVRMSVMTYNHLAYSVAIGDQQFILPESWLQRLQNN